MRRVVGLLPVDERMRTGKDVVIAGQDQIDPVLIAERPEVLTHELGQRAASAVAGIERLMAEHDDVLGRIRFDDFPDPLLQVRKVLVLVVISSLGINRNEQGVTVLEIIGRALDFFRPVVGIVCHRIEIADVCCLSAGVIIVMVARGDGIHHFLSGIHLIQVLPLIIYRAICSNVTREQDELQIADERFGLVDDLVCGTDPGRNRRIGMDVGDVDETERPGSGRLKLVVIRPTVAFSNLETITRIGSQIGKRRLALLDVSFAFKRDWPAFANHELLVRVGTVGRQGVLDDRAVRRGVPRDVYFLGHVGAGIDNDHRNVRGRGVNENGQAGK